MRPEWTLAKFKVRRWPSKGLDRSFLRLGIGFHRSNKAKTRVDIMEEVGASTRAHSFSRHLVCLAPGLVVKVEHEYS